MPLPPSHPVVQMFQIKTLNELHNPSEHELGLCGRLLSKDFFPGSLWVMSLRACVLYHLHGQLVPVLISVLSTMYLQTLAKPRSSLNESFS